MSSLGAPSTLVLNQYCYNTVEKGIWGGTSQAEAARDRVIKMHRLLLGLKSKVYIDDTREWSGW
jgi:hypothetical protein